MTDKQIAILKTAIAELGMVENPLNSNLQKYGEWYGLNGYAWCAMFVSWVFSHAGLPLPHIDTDNGMSYCPSAINYFKRENQVTYKPVAGDIVFYDWEGDKRFDHTGIFLQERASTPDTFIAIEGNTALGNDSNGGQVMLRIRNYKTVHIFVHPLVSI